MFTDKGHSFEVDWWSLGIIAFELLVGHTPFSSNSKKISDKLLQQRIQNEQPYLKKLLFLGSEAQIVMNFVQGLLTKSPEQRLGMLIILFFIPQNRNKFFVNFLSNK